MRLMKSFFTNLLYNIHFPLLAVSIINFILMPQVSARNITFISTKPEGEVLITEYDIALDQLFMDIFL